MDISKPSFLKVKGVKIAYWEQGEGESVVFAHGFADSSTAWSQMVEHLPEGFRYIFYDMKGYGLSDKPRDDKYSVSDQTDILDGVIRELDLNNVILAGHSYGGAVILSYILRREKRSLRSLRAVILLDSAGYSQRLTGLVARFNIPFIWRFVPDRMLAGMNVRDSFFNNEKIPEMKIREQTEDLADPDSRHILFHTARYLAQRETPIAPGELASLTSPVLVVWGKEDRIISLDNAHKFMEELPNADLKVIPECGHSPHEEEPIKTGSIISEFLKRLSNSS